MKTLTILMFTLFIATGCATIAKISQSRQVEILQTGLDLAALDAEFAMAEESLLINDFNKVEQDTVEFHLSNLQRVRDGLKAGDARILLEASEARKFLDNIEISFLQIEATYQGYTHRQGIPIDPGLRAYARSGRRVWSALDAMVDDGESVSVQAIETLISYAARGYLLYQTKGAALVLP